MDVEILKVIIDLGSTGILLAILTQVWAELKSANQYTRDLLTKQMLADEERADLKARVSSVERDNSTKRVD